MHKGLRVIKSGTKRQLVCFHFAGSNAEYFMPWKNFIDKQIAVYAVQLPGRGQRLSEPFTTCLHQCAEDISHRLAFLPQRPTYFFGHSMGATLAFETALRWESRGQMLEHLIVSGRLPPNKNSGTDYYRQSDESLIKKIIQLQGGSTDIFSHPELKSLFLPIIRADFEMIETYKRQCERSLLCSVSAFLGVDDTEVSSEEVKEWRQITRGVFDYHRFEGGHFYLNQRSPAFFDQLNKTITTRLTRANKFIK